MSAITAAQDHTSETLHQLFWHIGGYSLEKLLLIAAIATSFLLLGPWVIGAYRGVSRNDIRVAQRDVLIGIVCLLPVITFLGFFFFVGRGYWMALSANAISRKAPRKGNVFRIF